MIARTALAMALAAAVLPAAVRAQGSGATAPIAALQNALAHNEAGGASFPARAAALAPAVDQALDLPTILRNAVGLSYATIPAAQQAQLLQVFRQYTVASYVSNFSHDGDKFTIAPQTRQAGADTVVQTAVTSPSGSATRIDYVMRSGPAGTKAVDILLDGTISQVATERSEFRSVLASGGPEALIKSLSQKVSSLSDGQLQP